jgi:hypothetical protein
MLKNLIERSYSTKNNYGSAALGGAGGTVSMKSMQEPSVFIGKIVPNNS